MSKYSTGNYLIIGFNQVGVKILTQKAASQTHLGAIKEGTELVREGKLTSFVVLRVQHNSAMRDPDSWE